MRQKKQIPKGFTEDEIVDIIDSVVYKLARIFKFGYHDLDDMLQQGRLFAWEALPKYDVTRACDGENFSLSDKKQALKNFLWVHVRNRLFNFKRDHCGNPNQPCLNCPDDAYVQEQCIKYDNMQNCKSFARWARSIDSRRNIMYPIEFDSVNDEHEQNMKLFDEQSKSYQELLAFIDRKLPVIYREDYLKIINGISIYKRRKDKIKQVLSKILEEYYV